MFHNHPLIFGVLINCDMELLFDKFIDDYFLLIHEYIIL